MYNLERCFMSYFLRIFNRKRGPYLQICETLYNPKTKVCSNKNYKTLGYVEDLETKYPNPIEHFKEYVKVLNEKLAIDRERKIPEEEEEDVTKNIGYFLVKSLFNTLDVKDDLNALGVGYKYEKSLSKFIETMIYCQIIKPSSKLANSENVIPQIFGSEHFSEDQIYRMINFIGNDNQKYIELFNYHVNKLFPRNYKSVFFDCTNYYFEIDLPKDDKQKGPSKENRKEPIIGQALLLDGNQIPLAMEMYPGNESEKPHIRSLIEEMKQKANITGKTVQVADKGLNCAQNIYFAAKEGNNGYIFSKSIHGRNLSEAEKKWICLEDDFGNKWTNVLDKNGKLLFKYKECVDVFDYEFVNEEGKKIKFQQKEKRVVSYTPSLATKKKIEITNMVEKAKKLGTIKQIERSNIGDKVKYLEYGTDTGGANITINLSEKVVEEDYKFAGYNLIVTSETKLKGKEIYDIYHGLWRIEECFRILKSYLQARPVYLQKKQSIYGHFLICYLSLLLLRLLEFHIFKNEINTYDIVRFIRKFKATKVDDHYVSNLKNNDVVRKIKEVTQITTLDHLYLDDKKINNLLDYEF